MLAFDVGDLEFVEKEAAARAIKEFGRVDTLVLNAGVSVATCRHLDSRFVYIAALATTQFRSSCLRRLIHQLSPFRAKRTVTVVSSLCPVYSPKPPVNTHPPNPAFIIVTTSA